MQVVEQLVLMGSTAEGADTRRASLAEGLTQQLPAIKALTQTGGALLTEPVGQEAD